MLPLLLLIKFSSAFHIDPCDLYDDTYIEKLTSYDLIALIILFIFFVILIKNIKCD